LASSKGKSLEVTAQGPDAAAALTAVTTLINNGFDEN
jgi:phosphotransferase system HPr-like phosphotransfer protein